VIAWRDISGAALTELRALVKRVTLVDDDRDDHDDHRNDDGDYNDEIAE